MPITDAHKIKKLRLQNFTCFGDIEMEFSPGINVFIGENGTGKTHLLKVLYGFLRGLSYPHVEENDTGLTLNTTTFRLEKLLKGIFKVASLSELISRRKNNSEVSFSILNEEIAFQIENEKLEISKELAIAGEISNIYLPPNEMLSWYEGFSAAYRNRESAIDETYYYLALSLELLPLKGEKRGELQHLVDELLGKSGINKVALEKGHFVVELNDKQKYQAQLVAQGLNKIAQVVYLILNGSIKKGTILFWDEPETGLNPKYIALISKFLQTLAKADVQIYIATHDYLLAHQLSLSAEYRAVENSMPEMKFFSLYKGEDHNTKVESGATLSEIEHNPILDEYAALHDREINLYSKSLK